MRIASDCILPLFVLIMCACMEVNPAGTAAYQNPAYPDVEKGYFFCGEDPADCVFAPGTHTVWISEASNNRLLYRDVSKAVVNPFISDTLFLDFSPKLLAAPPSGSIIYVSKYSGNDIYTVDTQDLTFQRVYSSESSIYTIELSPDGSEMFIGSQGAPWHVESVSTATWEQIAYLGTEWPVYRLEISPDGSLAAIGNSGRQDIVILEASTLTPLDTLNLPMRTGTMAFLQNSTQLTVLDASSSRPFMIKLDLANGNEVFMSRPYNSYLVNTRINGTNTLLLPRNQDERISVLNMENMIFAPSIPVDDRIGSICCSYDGEYIVTVSKTATPGRATVFYYEN